MSQERPRMNAYLSNALSSVGVFSLSEDPTNILMWSHYASNHEGIAIGFEKNGKLANKEYCRPVKYQKDLPKVDITKGIMNCVNFFSGGQRPQSFVQLKDPQIQRVLLTKTTDWEYEQEWRYFEPNYGSFDFPGKMTEVIFGLKCPKAEIYSIIELCRENFSYNIIFKKVVNANDSSRLQLKPMKI